MADFTSGDIDWCWGSLRPWQILHSKLAERERCGGMLDVWEVVDQTLGATTNLRGRDQEGDGGRSHGLQFLGDDGEFWRHGGVMEARIREWLARRDEEEAAVRSDMKKCSKESVMSTSSAIAIAWAAEDRYEYAVEEEEEEEEGEDAPDDDEEKEEDYSLIYGESIGEEDANDYDYEDNYDYNEVIRESAIVVVNKCCMGRAAAAAADQDEEAEGAANMATPCPDVEEVQFDLCPVCLEKLLPSQALLPLACRHAFHTDCLSPWLQRQPHACCPCCRAPIASATLEDAPPIVAAAPLDLEVEVSMLPTESLEYSCEDEEEGSSDIMGLLANMEAALEHLGFRS